MRCLPALSDVPGARSLNTAQSQYVVVWLSALGSARFGGRDLLVVVLQLVGLSRLKFTTKIRRKIFVILKLYQGVLARLLMQATGHQTGEAFNHYMGVDQLRLLEEYMHKSARRKVV